MISKGHFVCSSNVQVIAIADAERVIRIKDMYCVPFFILFSLFVMGSALLLELVACINYFNPHMDGMGREGPKRYIFETSFTQTLLERSSSMCSSISMLEKM